MKNKNIYEFRKYANIEPELKTKVKDEHKIFSYLDMILFEYLSVIDSFKIVYLRTNNWTCPEILARICHQRMIQYLESYFDRNLSFFYRGDPDWSAQAHTQKFIQFWKIMNKDPQTALNLSVSHLFAACLDPDEHQRLIEGYQNEIKKGCVRKRSSCEEFEQKDRPLKFYTFSFDKKKEKLIREKFQPLSTIDRNSYISHYIDNCSRTTTFFYRKTYDLEDQDHKISNFDFMTIKVGMPRSLYSNSDNDNDNNSCLAEAFSSSWNGENVIFKNPEILVELASPPRPIPQKFKRTNNKFDPIHLIIKMLVPIFYFSFICCAFYGGIKSIAILDVDFE